jgi:hypothetical protein
MTPNKGGRPPAAPHLQRINVPLRLPRWLVQWMDDEFPCSTRAEVIEDALIKAHKIKPPRVG